MSIDELIQRLTQLRAELGFDALLNFHSQALEDQSGDGDLCVWAAEDLTVEINDQNEAATVDFYFSRF